MEATCSPTEDNYELWFELAQKVDIGLEMNLINWWHEDGWLLRTFDQVVNAILEKKVKFTK